MSSVMARGRRGLGPGHVVAAVVVAAGVFAAAVYATQPYFPGDTAVLVQHVGTVLHAIGRGQWTRWGGQFPLLQQLAAAPMKLAGLSDAQAEEGLVVVNLAAFAALLAVAWAHLRRLSGTVAFVFLAVLLVGPFPWYGHASFGEMLAAAVTLGFVVAVLEGRSGWLVVLLMILAGVSKDVAAPFLAIIGLAALQLRVAAAGERLRPRHVLPLAAGAAGGLAVSALFNLAQFGTLTNAVYLQSSFLVHDPGIQARFFLAIWASPNGGMLPFWPAWVALVALAGVAGWQAAAGRPPWASPVLRAQLLGAAALVGLAAGFAGFNAPLGWIAWGPRYLMPWAPAVALLACSAAGEHLSALLARLAAHSLAWWVAAGVLVVSGIPHFLLLFRQSLWYPLWATDAVCPVVPYIEKGATYYYRCSLYMMWGKRSILLPPYAIEHGTRALALAAACGAVVLLLAHLARRDAATIPRDA